MKNGYLFAFAGIDGSGKTTQLEMLQKKLQERNLNPVKSRAVLKHEKELLESLIRKFGRRSVEIMFIFQAFHTRQRKRVEKLLKEGRIILADRWNESFWMYHENFGPLKNKPDYLEALDEIAFQEITPDLTFLLDVPVNIAEKRILNEKRDILEKEKREIFKEARKYYLKIAKQKKEWIIIDGSLPRKKVNKKVCKHLKTFVL